ncbi:hypothetical protein Agabi119p4_8393 [Agaricus bisporus var. burnettii]|uniref:Uncharacterized protein n=1 Tax=Agaricus bisporus var. burnettii TaxID=192524 RepID=A0A8H7C6I3_AGABI|nr:hypothetical protein Agabi119p4_8393 [Agaricus bisporus var. burnettii]
MITVYEILLLGPGNHRGCAQTIALGPIWVIWFFERGTRESDSYSELNPDHSSTGRTIGVRKMAKREMLQYVSTYSCDRLLVPSVALMNANEMPFALTWLKSTFGWKPETSIP